MGSSSSKESAGEKVENVEKAEAVDLRDHEALRVALDVYSIEFIKKAGYAIDHTVDDVVSVISIVAIVLALVAQFWGKIDPASKGAPVSVLVPCVVGYFTLAGITSYITSYASKGVIVRTKPSAGLPALKLQSTMKPLDEEYTLTLTMGKESHTRKAFIGKLFDEDGGIQLKTLSVMVNELLHEMDAPSESSNDDDSKKEQ